MGLVIAGCGGGGGGDDDKGFDLTATVDGKSVDSFHVSNGQGGTLNVNSGQEAVLKSSDGVTWTVQSADATVAYTQVKDPTDTVLDYNLSSAAGGQIVLAVASKEDASLTATVTVVVAPQQYTRKDAVVGAYSIYDVTDTSVTGTLTPSSYERLTTAVNTDGSYTTNSLNALLTVTDTYTANADGNRLSRAYVATYGTRNGDNCTYTPDRHYLSYPMYVGKTWTATWDYACTSAAHETGELNAVVEAFEPVTVGAGTFDALRVRLDTKITNSNDTNLANGSAGTAQYQIAILGWYVPSLGQYVKFQRDWTYVGSTPSYYVSHEIESMRETGQQ
ncbi:MULTISPECIES: hypothetical protein [unclassified Achromobacter]|uniref:hypothetical protein n=1 Tax=unclassified Achromobacter TaxID=2626865 RepID=UPI000B5197D4|nr:MULTISPECIES: hypothetical protein [unclassified Achromobacter]OWT67332.1 hypothetical protein CEY05_30550 [Achromobacter sp. HZ34]OWT67349.1 hypothetical protein CEY04_30625 [Achromobacter sp. HZ28]